MHGHSGKESWRCFYYFIIICYRSQLRSYPGEEV